MHFMSSLLYVLAIIPFCILNLYIFKLNYYKFQRNILFFLKPANIGPKKHPKPLNKFTMPVALPNFSRPTKSHKYIVVKQFSPACFSKLFFYCKKLYLRGYNL